MALSNRRLAPVVFVVLLLAGLAWHSWRQSRALQGQPPVTSLEAANFGNFRNAFNHSSGSARLLVLLSPT